MGNSKDNSMKKFKNNILKPVVFCVLEWIIPWGFIYAVQDITKYLKNKLRSNGNDREINK